MEKQEQCWEMQRARRRQLDEQIERLESEQGEAGRGAQAGRSPHEQLVHALKEERKAAEGKLEELRAIGENAWRELRKGVDEAFTSLPGAVEKAVSDLRRGLGGS